MDMSDTINLVLKVMLLTGLSAGLIFICLQLLIRRLEHSSRRAGHPPA
jgi:hypothetical protein